MTKLLYLDCSAGISGDMTAAALLDVGGDEAAVRRALDSLEVEGFRVEISTVVKSGLTVRDFNVIPDAPWENHDHDMDYLHGNGFQNLHGADSVTKDAGVKHPCALEHTHHAGNPHHRHLADIEAIIDNASMTDTAKELACRMFGFVAAAEARVHGVAPEEVHFHEVGAIDSIADIVAIAVAFDSLGVDGVIVGDLPFGSGSVRCQHGLIPVPAPATLAIAEAASLPMVSSSVEGELVTPTGAAVAATLRSVDALPERFRVCSVGMGAGKRAYDTSGILRAIIIEPEE